MVDVMGSLSVAGLIAGRNCDRAGLGHFALVPILVGTRAVLDLAVGLPQVARRVRLEPAARFGRAAGPSGRNRLASGRPAT